MVAQLVQYDDPVARTCTDLCGKVLQQDLIHAAPVGTQSGSGGIGQELERQAFTHALATGLVVAPQRADARSVQHMQQ